MHILIYSNFIIVSLEIKGAQIASLGPLVDPEPILRTPRQFKIVCVLPAGTGC